MPTPRTLRDSRPAIWQQLLDAAVVSASMADEALRWMEFTQTSFLADQRPVAERIRQVSTEMGRHDLQRRADLVRANIKVRQDSLEEGAALARAVRAEAEQAGDAFAVARSHFVLAWVSILLGDTAEAKVHGIRCVEMLPDSAPREFLVDHLALVAIACNPAPESEHYFEEALALNDQCEDTSRSLMIHNNMAYTALGRGETAGALAHVEAMIADSERLGLGLRPVHLDTVARTYIANGRYDDAIATLAPIWDALPDADIDTILAGEPHALPAGLIALAQAHRLLGHFDKAQDLLDRAARPIEQRNVQLVGPEVLKEQAQLYADRGMFDKAYHTYVEFHEAIVALQTEEQQARARVVQATFETDRVRRDAERFREMAMRDALTGIYNRRYSDDLLVAEVATAARTGSPLSVAIIDVDFFKRINDQLSHKVGDRVLQALATVLVSTRPATDTVCRLGGEEFTVCMPGAASEDAFRRCESLRRAVQEHDWSPLTDGRAVTVSIGVATAETGQTSASALLSEADRNLYTAKRSGRNRVVSS